MAGEGGLQGDLGRGLVADFADGDDLRVLPQQRLQARLEREPGGQR